VVIRNELGTSVEKQKLETSTGKARGVARNRKPVDAKTVGGINSRSRSGVAKLNSKPNAAKASDKIGTNSNAGHSSERAVEGTEAEKKRVKAVSVALKKKPVVKKLVTRKPTIKRSS
jgi:hypothetical protein